MTITLEVGKRYVLRNKGITGPMEMITTNGDYCMRANFDGMDRHWPTDGRWDGPGDISNHERDCIALYEEPGTPAPTRTDESIRHEEVMAVLRRIADALAPTVTDKAEQTKAREWWLAVNRYGEVAGHGRTCVEAVHQKDKLNKDGDYQPYTIVKAREVLP